MNKRRIGLVIFVVLAAGVVLLNRKNVFLASDGNFKLLKISSAGYELQSVIRLHNPNWLSSTIKTVHEIFYINGKSVGEINLELNQGIPARKQTSFPVSIRFSNEDFRKIFLNDTVMSTKMEISSTGEILFQNLSGGGKISVNEKDSVSIQY